MHFPSLLLLLLGASSTTCALGLSYAPIRRAGAGPPPAAPRPAAPPSLPAAPKPVAPPSAPRPPKPNKPDAPDAPDGPDDDRTDNDSTTRIFRPYTSIVRVGQASTTQTWSRTTIQTSTSTSTTSAFRAVNTGAVSRVYVDSGVMVLISVVVAAVA